MRKVITGAFVSLDGVMQAPGGPDEDPSGGFQHGGWTHPYWDEASDAAMGESFSRPFALLLGRRTYDIFAAHWPHIQAEPGSLDAQVAETFNATTKYVATHRPETLTWRNSVGLGADVAAAVRALKQEDGPDLVTQGSTELLHLLLAADLVDTLNLLTYPVILGKGKRLFDAGSAPRALTLTKSTVSPSGVVIATYERGGEVRHGSFALPEPTPEELERRRTLA